MAPILPCEDPLPCLNNFAGEVYSSPAPGAGCTNPAFIPTLLTAANFTPTSSDSITLVYTDGTTTSVPYTSGTGWVIPTSPAVAEIDIPPFPEEGHNTSTPMAFNIYGYAAPTVSTTSSPPLAGAAGDGPARGADGPRPDGDPGPATAPGRAGGVA